MAKRTSLFHEAGLITVTMCVTDVFFCLSLFQSGHWGRVEWAHDLSQQETQARLAAAVLFIHMNSSSTFVQSKQQLVAT